MWWNVRSTQFQTLQGWGLPHSLGMCKRLQGPRQQRGEIAITSMIVSRRLFGWTLEQLFLVDQECSSCLPEFHRERITLIFFSLFVGVLCMWAPLCTPPKNPDVFSPGILHPILLPPFPWENSVFEQCWFIFHGKSAHSAAQQDGILHSLCYFLPPTILDGNQSLLKG